LLLLFFLVSFSLYHVVIVSRMCAPRLIHASLGQPDSSSMLHRSETWPVRKENEVALQRAQMRMVRWL